MDLPPIGVDEKNPLLRKNRLSTGIPDLDIVLEGGYPNPGNVMLSGPSGVEKEAIAGHFIAAADPKKENVIIISADSTPENLQEKATSFGIDLMKENVYFVDCYSMTLGQKKELPQSENRAYASGPGALNDVSIFLNDMIKKSAGKRLRVVFHTLSTFVLYNPKESITKFLQVVEGRLRSADATALYLVEEGVHDKQTLSLLEHGMDALYFLRETGGKFELIVPSIDVPIPVRLSPSGIAVV